MNRQQLIVALAGVLLLTALYFFGNTVSPKGKPAVAAKASGEIPLDIKDILQASTAKLSPAQLAYVNRLDNAVVRGDVKNQQLQAYRQLAAFWKDSVQDSFLPAMYYMGEVAKLENSEKSLTFAAQLFLNNLRGQQSRLRTWMANQSKELFERALALDPKNDSVKVGLGACAIFGASAGEPQQIMQGIQQILEVARRDSNNMYAQFMLGLGGMESGQVDRAIDRLSRVVHREPGNLEAVLTLAEAYEQAGNKAAAIGQYQQARKLVADQQVIKEIDQRIKTLQ